MSENIRSLAGRGVARRALLKSSAVLAGAIAAPAIVSRSALSSSGEVNYMGWAGYDFTAEFDAFTKKTGIKVNFNEQPDNESIFAQAKLSLQTGTVDFCEPTVERTQAFVENGIIQPWDAAKINLDGYEPGLVSGAAGEMASVDGQRYFVPAVWGTEALVYNTQEAPMEYGTASLGDLFDPKYVGAVTVRPHSALAAMGRYLESQGKLPHPFVESYKDMAVMRANWDVILEEAIKAKPNIAQFWKGENEAQSAFRTNGCVLGQCWDSTGFNLQSEGLPFAYLAPKEGAFAWNQGYTLLRNAKNVEQAHEFANFIATPEGSAMHAEAFRANPVAKGAIDLADPKVSAFYKASFPGDALSKLWWWPTQSSEFLTLRNEYADKYQAA
jgi:spermidine/putrescine transport system substrate-binding protein